MNKKLGIFGPYPPPLGGISVHISRLEAFLKKEKIDYEIYNHGFIEQENIIATKKKLVWYFKMLFIREFNTFHFHQFFLFHFLYYFIFSLFRDEKIIVTIHSERILSYSRIKRKINPCCSISSSPQNIKHTNSISLGTSKLFTSKNS